MPHRWVTGLWAFCLIALLPFSLWADAGRGPVTNLPLPHFVSLNAAEGNVRLGPSTSHRVDWIFKRRDMPLQIVAEYGRWRRVVDRDGAGVIADLGNCRNDWCELEVEGAKGWTEMGNLWGVTPGEVRG